MQFEFWSQCFKLKKILFDKVRNNPNKFSVFSEYKRILGALISMAMVLVQQTAPLCQSVVDFRKTLLKSATDKSEDSIVKVLIPFSNELFLLN